MRSGGVQNAAEKGRLKGKNLGRHQKDVWKPCNPLKSHKTAKDFFEKIRITRSTLQLIGKDGRVTVTLIAPCRLAKNLPGDGGALWGVTIM